MDKKEYIDNYCKGCQAYSICTYKKYGGQCHLIDNIDEIWNAAQKNLINKISQWIELNAEYYIIPSSEGRIDTTNMLIDMEQSMNK